MDVAFKSPDLDRLETDAAFNAGFSDAVVRAYRKAMAHIRAASDERTLYSRRSFHFEKLKGNRTGQYSMRLNDKWRLIVVIEGEDPHRTIVVCEIVDYH